MSRIISSFQANFKVYFYLACFQGRMEVKDMSCIGERIHFLRTNNKMTQQELADKTGVSRGNLSNYEKNKFLPASETIIALAEFFNVTTDWLLTGKEPTTTEEVAPPPAPALTDIEKQCLAKFNQLTYEQQIRILERMSVYIEEFNKKAILSDYQNGEEAAAGETA